MKAKLLILIGLFLVTNYGYSQVGINTTDIDFSAILQVESTNKGVLFPRLTLAQRDALDAAAPGSGVPGGLTLYCSDCCTNGTGSLFYHNGADWKSLDSDCTEIGTFPACNPSTTTLISSNHMNNSDLPDLFDGDLTESTQSNTWDLRMHQGSGGDIVEFALDEVLPAGAQVVIYWSDNEWSGGHLGLAVDLELGASTSQSSIDTLLGTLPNATNDSNGSDDFILTITIVSDTDTITVKSSVDGTGSDMINGCGEYSYTIRVLNLLGEEVLTCWGTVIAEDKTSGCGRYTRGCYATVRRLRE